MDIVYMSVGFLLASYSIVANDAIQTLGTFLASNQKRPWWVLWGYAGSILAMVLIYGWIVNGGDVAYGRLDKVPHPQPFAWFYVVPPVVLLALTRGGVPVSTTFLVLTIFAPKNLGKMVTKSLAGYVVAFVAALLLYWLISKAIERKFLDTKDEDPPTHWVVLQWLTTGFLWSQWLIQDLANIFVYLPREVSWLEFSVALVAMECLLAYTFFTAGGEIQKIVTSKTNTNDIRSAAIINFMFGLVLMIFKEYSKIPMSTTWVFLGLLAGREIAMTARLSVRSQRETLKDVGSDMAKAFAGLVVSVIVAVALPMMVGSEVPSFGL
jgi:hypothetical protein